MDSQGFNLRTDGAQQPGAFSIPKGVLHQAWKASSSAYRSQESFSVIVSQDQRSVYIAFSASADTDIFGADSKFGEGEINTDNGLFGSLKDTLSGQPAHVNQWVLKRFIYIWTNSKVEEKVVEAQKQGKTVVFVGHSLGGAIAVLATVCMLEKRLGHGSPFCVTFGCPLIGDDKFARAIRRHGWAAQFCHVVSRHDIFPRVVLAPLKSVSEPLQALLPYWGSAMAAYDSDSADHHMREEFPLSEQQIAQFLSTVLQHASALANYTTAAAMAPTSIVMGSIKPLVKLSPYRPFGYYLFCSSSGAICVQNPVAVLQLLFYTLQNSDTSLDATLEACISDHTGYGDYISKITEDIRTVEEFTNLAISEATVAFEGRLAAKMEALGIGIQNLRARLALRAAGELEKRLQANSQKLDIEFEKPLRAATKNPDNKKPMAIIEDYKKQCELRGIGCYDAFKLQEQDRTDFHVNLARLQLAAFWDELIEMLEKHELPDNFLSGEKWIEAGTAYRVLVEPMDIANFHRLGKHEDTGHYMLRGRPRRYRYVEEWAKDRHGSTPDSCFWAHFEELSHSLRNPREDPAGVRSKCLEFQKVVKKMIDSHDLPRDIFLERSSFMKWWKEELTADDKSASPLLDFMENEKWRHYGWPANEPSNQTAPTSCV